MDERIKEFYDLLMKEEPFSGMLKYYDYGNFVEFVVSRWGDVCTYRVYQNGEITAR